MSDWQPIETAPKDGLIDLWVVFFPSGEGKRIPDCFWGRGYEEKDGWIADHGGHGVEWGPNKWGARPGVSCEATHWMPLPPPPETAG